MCVVVYVYCFVDFVLLCGDPHLFSGCSVHARPELGSAPHFLRIVVEVKACGPPHIIRCGGDKTWACSL